MTRLSALLLCCCLVGLLTACGPPVPRSTMPADFPPLWSLAPPEYTLSELARLADRACVRVEADAPGQTPLPHALSLEAGKPPPPWTQQICRDFGRFVATETGRPITETAVADIVDLEGEGLPEISCQLICPDQDCGFFLLTEGAGGCWVPDYAD